MSYKAEIIVEEDPDKVQKCLEPENISRERSSFKIKKSDDKLIISIEAKDAIALRATLNAITQMLAVYHKMKQVGG